MVSSFCNLITDVCRLCEVAYKVDNEKATSGEKEGVGLCSKCSMLGQDPSKYNSLYNQEDNGTASAANVGDDDNVGGFGDDDDWGDISYDEEKVGRTQSCTYSYDFWAIVNVENHDFTSQAGESQGRDRLRL